MWVRTGALAGVLLLAAGSASSRNSVTFSDLAGDSGRGPDITTIAVSNDDIHEITLQVTLENRPFAESDRIVVWLDSDRDPNTGRVTGTGAGANYSITYALALTFGGGRAFVLPRADLTRWAGDTAEPLPQVRIHHSYDEQRRVLTLSFNQFALGQTGDLHFWLQSFGPGSVDNAPESGRFSYAVIGDRTAPIVRSSAASARRGSFATLRYRIQDANPTSETLTITRAGRRVARLTRALRPFPQANVTVRWRVPQGLVPGSLRYCVVAVDESRNRSRPGCAGIRVT